MKKLIARAIGETMRIKGYTPHFGAMLVTEVFDDLMKNKETTLKEKLWAYKRGFVSTKIKQYGLTEENHSLYVSDFAYHKMYPLNHEFNFWIDDKLTTKYILSGFKEYVPAYYCHIKKKKEIIPLMNGKVKNIEDIIQLLQEKQDLAFKLSASTFGVGFYRVSYRDQCYVVNNKPYTDEESFIQFLNGLENYLVTEYIVAHDDIREVSDFGLNTLRVMVINEPGKKPVLANGLMRFTTEKSGAVDNGFAGGIFSIVDMKTGRYFDARRMENGQIVHYDLHPDTNKKIEGIVPHWELINERLIEISEYLSEVTYMGFDIAITNDSFKIIEINSHQGIAIFQFYYPLLADNRATPFFKEMIRA